VDHLVEGEAVLLSVGDSKRSRDDIIDAYVSKKTPYYYYSAGLPWGEPLYATIGTQDKDGTWWYQDITFTSVRAGANFTNITSGAENVPTSTTFTWNSWPNAQLYYLQVGTGTTGKKSYNVVNSGDLSPATTSLPVAGMPANRLLYAQIYTETDGVWYHDTFWFDTGPS
jgi:hypothetical protein